MKQRSRNDITDQYLKTFIGQMRTSIYSHQKNRLLCFFCFDYRFNKKGINALFTAIDSINNRQGASPFEKYSHVLKAIYDHSTQSDEGLRHLLQREVKKQLIHQEEAAFSDSTEDLSRAINELCDHASYSSKEHYDFAKKWKVADTPDSYPVWQYLQEKVLTNLKEGIYARIGTDITKCFGLESISVRNKENDDQYCQMPTFYKHSEEEKDMPILNDEKLKKELEIWTQFNLVQFCTEYFLSCAPLYQKYKQSIKALGEEISTCILIPLLELTVEAHQKAKKRIDENAIQDGVAVFNKNINHISAAYELIEQGASCRYNIAETGEISLIASYSGSLLPNRSNQPIKEREAISEKETLISEIESNIQRIEKNRYILECHHQEKVQTLRRLITHIKNYTDTKTDQLLEKIIYDFIKNDPRSASLLKHRRCLHFFTKTKTQQLLEKYSPGCFTALKSSSPQRQHFV